MTRAGKHFTYPKEPTRTTNLDGLWNLNEVNTHIKNDNWPDSNLNTSRNQYNIGAAYISFATINNPNLHLGMVYLNAVESQS